MFLIYICLFVIWDSQPFCWIFFPILFLVPKVGFTLIFFFLIYWLEIWKWHFFPPRFKILLWRDRFLPHQCVFFLLHGPVSSIWLLFSEECEAIKNMIVESLCVGKMFCSAFPLNRESYLVTVGSVDGSVLSLRLIKSSGKESSSLFL